MSADKLCIQCNKRKMLWEYYKHPKMADGRLNRCKECTKANALNYRQENIERVRAYDRERGLLSHRKEKAKQYAADPTKRGIIRALKRRWALRNGSKKSAHGKVLRALAKGILTKKCCELCGDLDTEAHHEDYSKPLDVRWLCIKHHNQVHKDLRASKRLRGSTG